MPKNQYQKRMNKSSAGGSAGGGSVSVGGGGGTIPETVSVQSGNTVDTAGRHTHAVDASSNPGANERLLKTDSEGQLHLAGVEFDQAAPVSVIFQEDGIAIIGDSLAIVPDSGQLAAAVDSDDTTIDFGRAITPGVFVIIRGVTAARNRAVEFLQVGSLVSGTTYNVFRDVTNLNATDPAWPSGMPYAVLGAQGAGRLWMTTKPARYWLSLQGATADAYTNVVAIGDLNGGWGYAAPTYGMALGEYGAGKANLTWDPVNGLRIRRHTETLIQLDNDGHALIAGWEIEPAALSKNGAILGSDGYLSLGLGDEIVRLDAINPQYRMWVGDAEPADAPFSVTKMGAIKATYGQIGGWSLSKYSLVGDDIVLSSGGYIHAGDLEEGDVLVIDSSDDTHRLWAGATLKNDAPFAVLKNGAILAAAGAIGGWTIDTTKLQKLTANVGIVLDSDTPKIQVGNTAGTHIVINGATGAIGTSNFASGVSGWQARQAGDAEFNNVSVRGELHAAVMAYGEQHVNSGTLVVAKSAGKLREDTTPPPNGPFPIDIEDPDTGHIQLFAPGDILRIKDGSGYDNWFSVIAVHDQATFWRYECTKVHGGAATFRAGAAVVDYGPSGSGYLVMTADLAGAPYYDVQTHSGSPWSDAVVRVRLGNLDGITDAGLNPSGYGLYATNVFLRGDMIAGGGAVTLNQWGIEINSDTLGDAITWTVGGDPRARIRYQSDHLEHLVYAGRSISRFRMDGALSGPTWQGWASFSEASGLPDTQFVGLLLGALGKPDAMLDVRGRAYISDLVGIGTSAPGAMLDVRGDVIINENGGNYDTRIEGDTDANLLFVDASADRVGVGTATPEAKFHAVGAYPAFYLERVDTATNSVRVVGDLLATTSNNMVDGFGASFRLGIRDNAGVYNPLADFAAVRAGADNTGDLVLRTIAAGVAAEWVRLKSTGLFLYRGDLAAYRNATEYTGYIYVPLATPLVSTSFDGDSFSTTATTKIDTSAVFGAPVGIKAAMVRLIARDSGAHPQTSLHVTLSTGSDMLTTAQMSVRQPGADVMVENCGIVTCDANGDFYYTVNASGAGTTDIWLSIVGYFI